MDFFTQNYKHDRLSRLCSLADAFLKELRPDSPLLPIQLKDSLSYDLGLDSLTKMEFFCRVEKIFNIKFSEASLAEIDTLADVADKISGCVQANMPFDRPAESFKKAESQALTDNFLIEQLKKHAQHAAPYLFLKSTPEASAVLSYATLLDLSQKIAGQLLKQNIPPNCHIGLFTEDNADFIIAFFGILLANAVPILMKPPRSLVDLINIKTLHSIEFFIEPQTANPHSACHAQIKIFTVRALLSQKDTAIFSQNTTGNSPIAFIILPSDATDKNKKTLFTYENLQNIFQNFKSTYHLQPSDKFISHISLTETTGLLHWLCCFYYHIPVLLTIKLQASRWLWELHYFRATLTLASATFYSKELLSIKPRKKEGLDLHCWRAAIAPEKIYSEKFLPQLSKKYRKQHWMLSRFFCTEKLMTHTPQQKNNRNKLNQWLFKITQKIIYACDYSARFIYTFYVWLLYFSLLPFYLFTVTISPKKLSKKISKWWLKKIFQWMGCAPRIDGQHHIPANTPVIFVANHASYTDAPLLMGILPETSIFTVRKESFYTPIIGRIIKRFNYLMVDRRNFSACLETSQRIVKLLQEKKSIVIFPEATFDYATGLRPFKMGAFLAAAQTHTPICPISIKGTRKLWRCYTWLARHTQLHITIGKPIYPSNTSWQATIELSQTVRTEILKNCGESALAINTAGVEGLPPYRHNKNSHNQAVSSSAI